MRLRTRIVLVTAGAVLLPTLLLFWWSRDGLPELLLERAAEDLEARARLVAATTAGEPFDDALADRLGEASGLRVTLIGRDGRVLGDSRVSTRRIPSVENHGDRPEVRAALRDSVGTATRPSATVALPLLYVAVPDSRGVVRVATDRSTVTAPADRVGRLALGLGAGTLLLLLVAGALLERFVARPFRRLRRHAEAMAEGAADFRHRPSGDDEPAALARALDRLGDRLDEAGAIRRGEAELQALLDRLEEGLALVDRDGAVLRANRAFREWTGREDVQGEQVATLFRDPEVDDAVEQGLEGEADSRDVELGERTVRLSVRAHPGGVLLVLRDLTRLRKLEGVRRDFVANVSHELKTPLTSVIGYAEPLTEPDTPPDQVRTFAERILANGVRMRRLVEELLDLSRIEGGAWEPEPTRVEIGPLARSVWGELVPVSGEGEEDARLEIDGDGPPAVRADPEALRQILRNLLDNALRHAPESTAVRVATRAEDGGVRVEVSDAGPGIPAKHLERVFERFYRVDAGRSRESGGTGLGLSIVKHLVAAHGGEVGADSRVGEGTTLWFTLPAP